VTTAMRQFRLIYSRAAPRWPCTNLQKRDLEKAQMNSTTSTFLSHNYYLKRNMNIWMDEKSSTFVSLPSTLSDLLCDSYQGAFQCSRVSTRDSVLNKSGQSRCRIGSGTGIFTRALLDHESFAQTIEHLIAVEPSDGMRQVFSNQNKDPRVETNAGAFEVTGLDDGIADFVTVAQAWHWCPDFEAGVKEIARILKPEGVAFFIWNLEEYGTLGLSLQITNLGCSVEMPPTGFARLEINTKLLSRVLLNSDSISGELPLKRMHINIISKPRRNSHGTTLFQPQKKESLIASCPKAISLRSQRKTKINSVTISESTLTRIRPKYGLTKQTAFSNILTKPSLLS
jgi:SAM-dependent methyltransferase